MTDQNHERRPTYTNSCCNVVATHVGAVEVSTRPVSVTLHRLAYGVEAEDVAEILHPRLYAEDAVSLVREITIEELERVKSAWPEDFVEGTHYETRTAPMMEVVTDHTFECPNKAHTNCKDEVKRLTQHLPWTLPGDPPTT